MECRGSLFSSKYPQGLSTKRVNKLKSKELNYIFVNSDIVLLTECWTNELSDLKFPGFQPFALHRKLKKRNAKRDSVGITIFLRDKYVSSDTLVQLQRRILCQRKRNINETKTKHKRAVNQTKMPNNGFI